jgi:hypothetical protein
MGSGADSKGIKTGDAILHEIPGNEKAKIDTAPKCPGTPPLDNMGIQGLIGAFEVYGRILAIQARIDGMKVQNATSALNGQYPQYVEHEFQQQAESIYLHVQQLQIMKNIQKIK